ncbi:hypothetical protein [Flavivirga jejuensis]|uniref:Metallo-beta-lactamase domain-containing protein n=1 Tax=Flavivirga jejuensis TaxID=870487 RepID=A0ABT8WMN0_9FLAO|nr:hypothetical protein [Flavivirga jejuensis]MDO5974413.1 hypothetical protein [Flavivirga jejuensis]
MKLIKTIKGIMLFVFFARIFFSCEEEKDIPNNDPIIALQSVVDSLGGIHVIENLKNISYTTTGASYEYEQNGPNQVEELLVNNYVYDLVSFIGERKLSINYKKNLGLFPFKYNSPKTEIIINDKRGMLEGQYNFGSIYLGFNQKVPLSIERMEALLKVQLMSNPLALIKVLAQETDLTTETSKGIFQLSTIIDNLKIEVVINPKTNLPERATIIESDFMFGDTPFVVNYSDWEPIGETKYPRCITHTFRGDVLRKETISSIALNNTDIPDDHFNVPILGEGGVYNKEKAERGYLFSQWYHRMFYMHLTLDQDLSKAFLLEEADLSQFNLRSQRVSDHIKIIGRPDVTIWGVAIKTSKGVYFVDSSINDIWAKAIMNTTRKAFPNEKFLGVIPTHIHGTHISGIREFAANMKDIYIGASGESFVKEVLASKHLLVPDTYENLNKMNKIHPVSEKEIIGDNEIVIYDFSIKDIPNNPHSKDLVAVYVPKEKTLIQTDFYYSGLAENVFNNKTLRQFQEPIKQSLKQRAQFVLKFIEEKQLDVEKIISTHGGVGSIDDVKVIANY